MLGISMPENNGIRSHGLPPQEARGKILLYSSLSSGMLSQNIGGAEAGSKRTVEVLQKLGFQLLYAAKPTMTDGAAGYIKGAVKSIHAVIRDLLRKDVALFYMIGFYDRNIYLEWLLMRAARMLHKKVVYEPKNGNLLATYRDGSRLYRSFLKKAVGCADVVFCQGQRYADFLEKMYGARCVYIPNYVMQRYLTPREARALRTPCGLLFFGRLSPTKNVAMMLEISKRLTDKGLQNRLTLIGACDEAYRMFLNQEIIRLGLSAEQICFMERMTFDDLTKSLQMADFFLFPSVNEKEGHSNALTEAMAFGVIPVASDVGFNREVLSNDALIVSEMNAEAYAQRIAELVSNDDIHALREQLMERVRENYSEEIVTERISMALDEILNPRNVSALGGSDKSI